MGATAATADQRFVFDGAYLRFDSDGNGVNASVSVTPITGSLAATDFFIL